MQSEKDLRSLLGEIASGQERDRKTLATIESRIALIHDEIKRTGETVTRLKLMFDNARRLAITHGEELQRISERLDKGAGGP